MWDAYLNMPTSFSSAMRKKVKGMFLKVPWVVVVKAKSTK